MIVSSECGVPVLEECAGLNSKAKSDWERKKRVHTQKSI